MPTISPVILGNRLPINLPEPQKLDNNSWLQVSAFNNFAGGIQSNNLLYMWGVNNTYQVGDGTTTNKSLPVQVSSSSFSQISAGFDHSAALTTDNYLYMWGNSSSTFIQTYNYSWNVISSNGGHNLAIRNDGLLFTWGLNTSGQLGDGTTLNRSSPVQIGTSSYAFVSAGNDHSLAVIDKSLYAWGLNSFFQNGQGTTTANRSSPVLITTAAVSFISVSAGNQFNAYVLSDGSLYTFGRNNVYQLGDSTTTSRSNPVTIGTERSYVSVSAGSDHSVAIDTVGNLYVWGNQLSVFAPIPTTISSWTQASAGDTQAAALTITGKAYFWGDSAQGQLGQGDTVRRSSPTQLFAGTSSFVQVASAARTSASIDTNYRLYTWGINDYGQLGIGSTINRSTPQQVNYLNKSYSQVALGTGANSGETYAIDTDNKLWSWGLNNIGQGGVVPNNSVTWSTIAIGSSFAIAIKSDGTLWAWGRNSEGQLGQGDTILRSLPTQIGSGSWKFVNAGLQSSFAIDTNDRLYGWGYNAFGNLGDGTTVNKSSPSLVDSSNGVSNYTQVNAQYQFTLAIDNLGRGWSWGRNLYGQLGINLQAGVTADRSRPVQVSFPAGVSVTQVSAGGAGSIGGGVGLAISTTNTLYAWGYNGAGALGDSTTINKSSPVQIGFDSWTFVNSGGYIDSSFAIRNDGILFAWGTGVSGQLGLNDNINRSSPTSVGGLPNPVTTVTHGNGGTALLLNDGTIWGMGNVNSRSTPAQIGNRNDWSFLADTTTDAIGFAALDVTNYAYVWGNTATIAGTGQASINLSAPVLVGYAGSLQPNLLDRYSSPTQVASTSSWSQIVAGDSFALAIDSNYKLFGWGNNSSSQVGDNTTINQYSPVQIGNSSWISVSAGLNHALAVRSDNTLWTWGNSTAIGLVTETLQFATMAIGKNNIYGVGTNGMLYAWGDNTAGQLGDLRTVNRSSPVMVGFNVAMPQNSTESNYTQVFAGNSFAFATDNNYKLYAWGNNNAGQLGVNSTLSRSWPLQVGQSSWSVVAAGTDHTIGLDVNQGIYAWGQYTTGESGIYDIGYSWNQIAGGLALRTDNTLWSWGNNVGDGTTIFKSSPVQIGSNEWSSIATIYDSTYVKAAVKTNGTLWLWGTNTFGQLGDSTTINKSSPVQVAGSWNQISIQSNHAAALDSASIMYTWGLNDKGQLGDGTTINKSSPALLTATGGFSTTSWLSVSAGYSHTTALNTSRVIYSWGDNSSGQLGINLGTAAHRSNPTILTGASSWTMISSGALHVHGITMGALLFSWGSNLYGQTGLNVGTAINRSSPTVVGASTWYEISAGLTSSLGITRTGQLFSWGANDVGQLGQNDIIQRSSPTIIGALTSWIKVGSISAIDNNNYGYVWGSNTGIFNTSINSSSPVIVGGFRWPVDKNYLPTKINNNSYLQIGVGNSYTIALDSNNILYGWGLNTSGQLGDTTAISKSSPTQLNAYSWNQLAVGYDHVLAIRNDTTLWTWGNSTAISLGVEPQSWVTIATGSTHSLAIRSDGALFAWGTGTSGQLGDGTLVSKSSPSVVGSSSWSQVAAGALFSMALDVNNYLYTWGNNAVGQVGRIGVIRSNPTQIFNFTDKSSYSNTLNNFDATYTSTVVPLSGAIAGEFRGGSRAITIPTGNEFAFGTGDFTLECWVWPNVNNYTTSAYVLGYGAYLSEEAIRIGFTAYQFQIVKDTAGSTAGTVVLSTPVDSFKVQTWYHIALVRQTGVLYAYINGALKGSLADTTDYSPTIYGLRIGAYSSQFGGGGVSFPFNGNISNVRAVKGVAVYTGNFTVPTSILTETQSAGTNISAITAGQCSLLALTDSTSISIPTYTSIDAGASHAYAIDSNNKLFGWGLNTSGQVLPYGNYPQNTYNSSVPVQVGLGYYNSFAVGYYNMAGIRNPDRFIFTWGYNNNGQLGLGDTITRSLPTQLGNNSWKQIAKGNQTTLAIRDDDTLWGWGLGTSGQIGYGTAASRSSPVQIAGNWKYISVGSTTSAGIKSDGTLWTWGINTFGQLGDNSSISKSSPVQISGGGSWTSVAVGGATMFGITTNNILYGWGANNGGGLADGTTINRSVPTLLASPFDVVSWTQVSVANHILALTTNGLLYTWGFSRFGELGVGVPSVNRSQPIQITNLTGIVGEPIPNTSNSWTFITAGAYMSAGINNNNLYVWGYNLLGSLGLGDTLNRSLPTQAGVGYSWQGAKFDIYDNDLLAPIGGWNSPAGLYFRSDNTIWTSGENTYGTLGDNTAVNKSTPVFLGAASFSTPVQINNSSWTTVGAGTDFTNAITSVGQLYNWGLNNVTQLGNYDTVTRNDSFVQLSGSWSKVAAGTSHSLAIKSDSTLWAWGGASAIVLSNVTVNSWIQIASNDSSSHCAAIRSDGTLWVWGLNTSGQIGDGTTIDKSSPTQIGAGSWSFVSVGTSNTMAVKTNGSLYAWGNNASGQLGDNSVISKSSPVFVAYGSFTQVALNGQFVLALKSGTPYVWGLNSSGQLGLGNTVSRSSPVALDQIPSSVIDNSTNSLAVAIAGSVYVSSETLPFANTITTKYLGPSPSGNLSIASNTVLALNSSAWTVECWVYQTATIASGNFALIAHNGNGGAGYWIIGVNGGFGTLWIDAGGSFRYFSGESLNTWNHLAAVLNSGTVSLYFNGVLSTSFAVGGGHGTQAAVLIGGGANPYLSTPVTFTGYISNFRIVKNVAVYTGNFTVPTTPLQATQSSGTNISAITGTNTSLLLMNTSNSVVYNSYSSLSASSSNFSLGITNLGLLYSWGNNAAYQLGLGDNTTTNRSNPTLVPTPLLSFTAVSAGASHSLALDSNSKVWTWGQGSSIGADFNSWTQVATGESHTLALRSDGRLFTWGLNTSGQLGQGDLVNRSNPVTIGASSWIFVNAGSLLSFAIRADNTLWAWGSNAGFVLGDGTSTNRNSPVQIGVGISVPSWKQVSAGISHAIGIASDNKLYVWGTNTLGVLGLGDTLNRSSPTILGSSSWTKISAGTTHNVAINSLGQLFAWGANDLRQLGDNTIISKSSPVQIGFGRSNASLVFSGSWSQVSAGLNHSLAIDSTNKLYTWGNQNAIILIPTVQSWMQISASDNGNFGLAIRNDGLLYGWGLNSTGQLGTFDTLNRSSPTLVSGLGWKRIATGTAHSLAIRQDDTIWAWGNNATWQLGDGSSVNRSSPVQIGASLGLSWTQVAAGTSHSGAIDSLGKLYMWGSAAGGAIGDNQTAANRSSPTQIGNSSWTSVSLGSSFTAGITSIGTLYAWGLNSLNQLGDNTIINKSSPVQIGVGRGLSFINVSSGIEHAAAIDTNYKLYAWGSANSVLLQNSTQSWAQVSASLSHNFTLAIRADGFLYAWGATTSGQLGDNQTAILSRSSPVLVGSDYSWNSVSAGNNFSLAIRADGSLWAWGLNSFNQLGDGTIVNKSSPVQIASGTSFTQISAGGVNSLAIATDFTVWSWGQNAVGQLGDGTTVNRTTPNSFIITGSSGSFTQISAGNSFAGVIDTTNKLYTFGNNGSGQLGIGVVTNRSTPVQVTSPSAWDDVSSGWSHMLGKTNTGTLYAWGDGSGGQLGYGTAANRSNPVQIGTSSWNQVSAGVSFSLGVMGDNKVYTWGVNAGGQLGINLTTNRSSPVLVTGIGTSSWTHVSAGLSHSMGIQSNGLLYGWGSNSAGSLGDNTSVTRSVPVLVGSTALNTSVPVPTKVGESSWTSVSAGTSFTAAIRSDFTIWAWGLNNAGQLGNNTTINRSSPVQVSGVGTSSYTQIAAGGSFTYAISTSNSLYVWGLGTTSQLGDFANISRSNPTLMSSTTVAGTQYPTPTLIDTTNSYVQVEAGTSYSAALRSDYSLYVWGLNNLGQLGDNSSITKSSPTLLAAATVDRQSWTLISTAASSSGLSAISNEKIYNWGLGTGGQLGDNSTITKSSPVQVFSSIVNNLGMIVPTKISLDISFTQISAGTSFSLARKAIDRTIVAWGTNQFGQYGDGTTVSTSYPVIVGQSPIVTDVSQAALTVTTPSGTPKSTIDSPFDTGSYNVSTYGGSLYLNGSSRGLIAADSTLNILANASGCSMEIWFKPTATGADQMILTQDSGGAATAQIFQLFVTATNFLSFTYFTTTARASAVTLTSTVKVNVNSWNHVLVTLTSATSGTLRIFLNGNFENGSLGVTPYAVTARATGIGSFNGSVLNPFTGLLTNLRMISGSIPTSYQTSLIIGLVDKSTFNSTITNNSVTFGTAVIPFASATAGYFLGNATRTGSNAYLTTPNAAGLQFGTGDFTVEFWIRKDTTYQAGTVMALNTASLGNWAIIMSAGNMFFQNGYTVNSLGSGVSINTYLPINTWVHVAVVRISGSTSIYINGTSRDSFADTQNYNGTGILNIGSTSSPTYGTLEGYLSNIRIVKGVGVYTGTFTSPSSPLAATQSSGTNIQAITGSQTSLLLLNDTSSAGTGPINSVITVPTSPLTETSQGATSTDIVYLGMRAIPEYTPSNVVAIGSTTAFLDTDTTIDTFGLNASGQVGNGTAINRSTPVTLGQNFTGLNTGFNVPIQVTSQNSWTAVSAGTSFSLARNADTFAYAWGLGTSGQLGRTFIAVTRSAPTIVGPNQSVTVLDTSIYSRTIIGDGTFYDTVNVPTAGAVAGTFNGTSDYLRSDSVISSIGSVASPFTIEGYAYVNTYTGYSTGRYLVALNTIAGGTNVLLLGVDRLYFNGALIGSGVSYQIPLNTWTHFAFSYTGLSYYWFINGVLITASATQLTTQPADCTFLIGTEADSANAGTLDNFFSGSLSSLRFSNKALYSGTFTPPTGILTDTSVGTSGANVVASLSSSEVGLLTYTTYAASINATTPPSFLSIDAGPGYGLGITTDNSLYAWGLGTSGQLGIGGITSRSSVTLVGATGQIVNTYTTSPVQVLPGTSGYTQVYAGQSFSYVLNDLNQTYFWGLNDVGQLGDNTTINKSTLTLASSGTLTILDVSDYNETITNYGSYYNDSYYIPFTNAVSAYFNGSTYVDIGTGTNTNLSTGDYTAECWFYPRQIASTNSNFISYGNYVTENGFGFGILNGAVRITLRTAGTSSVTSLSLGSITTNNWYHIALVRISGVVTVYLNGTLGATSSGASAGVSYNTSYGVRLGAGDVVASYAPGFYFYGYVSNFRLVKGVGVYTGNFTVPTIPLVKSQSSGTNISAISSAQTSLLMYNNSSSLTVSGTILYPYYLGYSNAGSLDSNNKLYAWGDNTAGQLGQRDTINRSSPTIVGNGNYINTGTQSPVQVSFGLPNSWSTVSAGKSFSYARDIFGSVYGWGLNSSGQLGQNDTINRSSPTLVGAAFTSVLDVSTYGHIITKVGTSFSTSIVPFSPSVAGAFNLTTSNTYLSIPTSTAFDLPGDFTIECWFNIDTTVAGSHMIIDGRYDVATPTGSYQLYYRSIGTSLAFWVNTAVLIQDPSPTRISANTWYHVAVVRSGVGSNNVTMYVNGTSVVTGTSTQDLTSTNTFYIGIQGYNLVADMVGYVSNIRIVKGVAVYTGNFTVPTSVLTVTQSAGVNINAITGTQTSLLTYTTQAATIVGGSPSYYNSISAGGSMGAAINSSNLLYTWGLGTSGQLGIDNAASRSNPTLVGNQLNSNTISPILAASASWAQASAGVSYSLAINADGSLWAWGLNNTYQLGQGDLINRSSIVQVGSGVTSFSDQSTNNFTITSVGNSFMKAVSPFANGSYDITIYGGSGSFDGTGDYLSLANNTALDPEADEFVMEAWVYITGLTGNNQGINGKGTFGVDGYSLFVTNSLLLSFIWNGTGGTTITGGTLNLNQWHHVAVVRNSSVIRLYLDGIGAVSSTACTTNITSTSTKYIGQARGGNPIIGYISNYRMMKGGRPATYDATSASLTVPTAPLTAITYTTLLTCSYINTNLFYALVASGNSTSIAVKSDGGLYTWGLGTSGILGYQSVTTRSVPTQVGTSSWSLVSSGLSHALGVESDSTLFAWGGNTTGQLGTNTLITRSSPVQVQGINLNTTSPTLVDGNWNSISAGLSYTGGIIANSLYIWGLNSSGQVGDGTTITKSSPTLVGNAFAIVDGSANNYAPTIVGGINISISLVPISNTSSIYLPTNSYLSFLNTTNLQFQSGAFTIEAFIRLSTVSTLDSIISKGGSGAAASGYNFYVDTGTLKFTIAGGAIDVGHPTTLVANIWYYVAVTRDSLNDIRLFVNGISSGVLVNTSYNFSQTSLLRIGVGRSNSNYLNGYISNLRLVKGTALYTSNFTVPTTPLTAVAGTQLLLATTVPSILYSSVYAGSAATYGLYTDGNLYAWGLGTTGQISGFASIINRSAPNQIGNQYIVVNMSSPVQIAAGSWSSISAGSSASAAIRQDYKLFTWGVGTAGKLGDGTTVLKSSPVQIGTNSWSQVSMSASHTAAIDSTGSLYTWGLNSSGQLGLTNVNAGGDVINRSSPVLVSNTTSWSKVAAGSSFTAAITTVNRLFMWGINTGGILGNNNTVSFSSPIQVTSVGTNSWTSVTTGGATAGGIQSDGSLYMWGSNTGQQNFGDIWYNAVSRSNPIQFGNTYAITTSQTRVPIKNGDNSWTQVEAGVNSSIGLVYRTSGQNGLLFTWGLNSSGQLGDNTTISKSSPVQVGVNTYLSVTVGSANAGAIGKATT